MYFVFAIKTRHSSSPNDNGKVSRKEIFKLFSRLNITELSILKRLILNLQQKKMMNFDCYDKYLRSISNNTLLWYYCYEKEILIQLAFAD